MRLSVRARREQELVELHVRLIPTGLARVPEDVVPKSEIGLEGLKATRKSCSKSSPESFLRNHKQIGRSQLYPQERIDR